MQTRCTVCHTAARPLNSQFVETSGKKKADRELSLAALRKKEPDRTARSGNIRMVQVLLKGAFKDGRLKYADVPVQRRPKPTPPRTRGSRPKRTPRSTRAAAAAKRAEAKRKADEAVAERKAAEAAEAALKAAEAKKAEEAKKAAEEAKKRGSR